MNSVLSQYVLGYCPSLGGHKELRYGDFRVLHVHTCNIKVNENNNKPLICHEQIKIELKYYQILKL
jgi:hypothetical protein